MNITEKLNEFEDLAVDVLAVFGPWLAPIPSAYLVGRAAHDHLLWHWSIAIIAAVAVESIGVVSIVLSLRLYEWNQTKNKTDPNAPLTLALVAAVFYFIVTIGLTVVLDVYPYLAKFAPAIFPLLAAIGAANIAMKNGQRRREVAKAEKKKSQKRTVTAVAKADTTRTDSGQLSGQFPGDFRQLTTAQKDTISNMTSGEVAQLAAISDRTARRWKEKVAANGYHK